MIMTCTPNRLCKRLPITHCEIEMAKIIAFYVALKSQVLAMFALFSRLLRKPLKVKECEMQNEK